MRYVCPIACCLVGHKRASSKLGLKLKTNIRLQKGSGDDHSFGRCSLPVLWHLHLAPFPRRNERLLVRFDSISEVAAQHLGG
ncbi:hypothetical protein JTE90_025628 [Oedothorax gibbosus]|uniref:Uncharacterized protein n=1 Tax=Oedothorax gibbosus TaxID=931172 RepID=A0AAV6VAE2_9ARAC|nr:hypothetical protein JTE90_025627 [Oedothorax gibbosus]KAG8192920.1 hypothetical protein JTE90_025628 [Oedothorax gibbosus]